MECNKRKNNVELCRICIMFFIVVHHCIVSGLACIEIGTLLGCAIFIVLPFNIAITSELLFLIYGTIKIIQTGAFLYYDMH